MDGCLATPAKYKEQKPVKATEKSGQEFYKCSFSEAQSILCFIYPTCCNQQGAVNLTLSASILYHPVKEPSRCMSQECDDANQRRSTQTGTVQLFKASPIKKTPLPPLHTHLITRHVEQKTSSTALGFKRIEQKVNVLIEFQPF